MGKIKKIIVSTISLIAGASAVCIAIPFVKNSFGSSNATDNNKNPVVENDNIINNDGYNKVLKGLEDCIEIKLNNPIKSVQVENIKADENEMAFYTLVTVNNATQSVVNYKLNYNNTEDVYTKYSDFIQKDLTKVSDEEISNFWNNISDLTTYENLKEVKGLTKVQNTNISSLTKLVFQDSANDSKLDENTKKQISESVGSYDNIELVESYFVSRGFDRQNDYYLYDFNGIAFLNGYQVEIHTTVSTYSMETDMNKLSEVVLETFKNEPEKFDILYSKASILNYTMLNNINKTNTKTAQDELSM